MREHNLKGQLVVIDLSSRTVRDANDHSGAGVKGSIGVRQHARKREVIVGDDRTRRGKVHPLTQLCRYGNTNQGRSRLWEAGHARLSE